MDPRLGPAGRGRAAGRFLQLDQLPRRCGERSRALAGGRIVGPCERLWGGFADHVSTWLLPGPERRAAAAERRAERAIELERYPAVLYAERRRAALEAERRRWGFMGEWR